MKALAFLPLIMLGAAAAPQSDCGASISEPGSTLPMPIDLAGRPSGSPGLTGQAFATLSDPELQAGCRSPLPSAAHESTLRSESGDILHSLPAPELFNPLAPSK